MILFCFNNIKFGWKAKPTGHHWPYIVPDVAYTGNQIAFGKTTRYITMITECLLYCVHTYTSKKCQIPCECAVSHIGIKHECCRLKWLH